MYCRQCGTKLEDGSVFCSKCGARQQEDVQVNAGASAGASAGAPQQKSAKRTVWIVIAIAVALTIVVAVIFTLLFLKLFEKVEDKIEETFVETVEEETVSPIREEPVEEKPVKEEPKPAPAPSDEEAFEETMQGAWVYCNNDRAEIFYRVFDGSGVIKCGYVESELMPSETIDKVLVAEDDHYKVEVTQEAWYYDFDSDEMTPEQKVTLDLYSEGDRFQSVYYIKVDGKKYYFVKMGEDFDERFYDHQIFDRYNTAVNHYLFEVAPSENEDPTGAWYTEIYDDRDNWAVSYKIEIKADGTATCDGWRNKDKGTYRKVRDNEIEITFDDCMADFPGEGWTATPDARYTVNMKISGDRAYIVVNGNDGITNLESGVMVR